MGFPVLAICEICLCLPTIIFALLPIISCHKRVPVTSTICNLLSNALWAAFIYGLYSMSKEDSFDYDKSELIWTLSIIGIVVVFLLFRFRFLTFSFLSETDSIQYVPSMVKNSFYDLYTLLEAITNLRANPPIIIIEGEAAHLVQVDSNRGNNESTSWTGETVVPYGSWIDVTEMPITLKKAYILDVYCSIEYKLTNELETTIQQERQKFENENRVRDSIFHSKVEVASPGFAPHFYASTRGSIPGYVKFLKSKGGETFREFLMFIGYHSLLECIWMMMLKKQNLVLKKNLSHENIEEWTPMWNKCPLDYHNIPTVI
ncbi:hypothetical protein M9Y10_033754 [Tritrichomonas musculus]|uniref:Uncharacterized protein n=1 Tax=Tritrichomonas musculus TaxID=1915356 RepID=A0ABR2KD07_9EUKA